MIFEEDFRFYPAGEDPEGADRYSERVVSLVVRRGFSALSGIESLPPRSDSRSRSPSRQRFGGKGHGKRKPESRFHHSSSRGSSDGHDRSCEGFSHNLADLVRYATIAHRKRMGNIIWVGWSPDRRKPSVLAKGSHLLMCSKTGILHIFNGMHQRRIERGHIDLELKYWLQSSTVAKDVEACYTYPQMGGYFRHESGCDPANFSEKKGGRPSAWETDSPASGTRKESDPKRRSKYLIQWREKKAERQWEPLPDDAELLSDEYKWRSIREPTASERDDAGPIRYKSPFDAEEVPKAPPPRSKRMRRGKRQVEMRDKMRVWVDSYEQASVAK